MLSKLREQIEAGIESGLHLGAQACVLRGGELVDRMSLGEAAPGVPLQHGSLMLWMSAGKPVTVLAVAQQLETGTWTLDMPVSEVIHEFAWGGKGDVTLRHLLTHTAGFRQVRMGWPESGWDGALAAICAADQEPGWVAGDTAGYAPQTGWFVLGDMLARVSGQDISTYLREAVLDPLELHNAWLGMPRAVYDEYASEGLFPQMPHTDRGGRQSGETGFERVCPPRPGGNFMASAWDMCRLYELLRCGGALDGVRLLKPETVQQITTRQRSGVFDLTFQSVVDFSLGFVMDSKRHLKAGRSAATIPYGYGSHASDATFGHSGFQSTTAFCDPQNELVVALAFNGFAGERGHRNRQHAALDAIYEELGVVVADGHG